MRVILTWPVLITIVLIYFLRSQKEVITHLIKRINQISFPGGKLDAGYDSNISKRAEILPASGTDGKNSAEDLPKKVSILESDFNNFLFESLQANKKIIHNLVDVFYRKGSFFAHKSISFPEKIKAIGNSINVNALEDLRYIETITESAQTSRENIVKAYIKSKVLIDYLRGQVTKWL